MTAGTARWRGILGSFILSFALLPGLPAQEPDEEGPDSEGKRVPAHGEERVRVEITKRGERSPGDRAGLPQPKRTDPSTFQTRIDARWRDARTIPAVESVLQALKSKDASVRRQAASRLAGQGEEGVESLVLLLGDGDLAVEDAALDALSRLGPEWTTFLASALGHPYFRVRSQVAKVLARRGRVASEAVGELSRAIRDENSFVRESAALALGEVGEPREEILPALLFALEDPDSFVRFRALESIARIGWAEPSHLDAIGTVLLLDDDSASRLSSARALVAIGTPPLIVVDKLGVGLADPEERVSREVAELLILELERFPIALPALFPRIGDPVYGPAVRGFLVTRTGQNLPDETSWRAWWDGNGRR